MVDMMRYTVPFDRIVAYMYDADTHCVGCTNRKHGTDADADNTDFNGIPNDAKDSEGNAIHPVFAIDMNTESVTACGNCGTVVCLACGNADKTRKPPARGRARKLSECANCRTAWETS